jgi:mRNA interferase RelE/StbE
MNFSVRIERDAYKSLSRINRQDKIRISAAIRGLRENPNKGAQLKGKMAPLRRIRVGDYRVIYRLESDEAVVMVIKIGHRREVYHGL